MAYTYKYPRPAVTADSIVITKEAEPKVLLIERGDEPVVVTGQDDAAKAEWWPLSDLPHLAFDHYEIMQEAIKVYNRHKE